MTSPEILVFLFFMITDPKTIPASRGGRRVYAVAVGLLATLLIAPFTTEFATKVAVLGALFARLRRAAGARSSLGSARPRVPDDASAARTAGRLVAGAVAVLGALAYTGLVVAAGIPARPDAGARQQR